MVRNSIIVLFLLYRRLEPRRNGLQWVHSTIKKGDEFVACYTLFNKYYPPRSYKQVFKIIFQMSVLSFDELHRRLKESSVS